jgi:nicotinamide-nucleotide amidase
LVLDPDLLASVERHFQRWGRTMSENNRRQAYKPAGALGIDNPVGTAPIFVVEENGKLIIVLPGVPREMKYLLDNTVLPYLRDKLHLTDVIIARNLRTCALGESNIDSLVGDLEHETNPTVGLAAHPGQTDVRITAKASSEEEALRLLAAMEARVRERLGDVIFGVDEETLEGVVVKLLREKGQTIALVETNTRGRLTQQLTTIDDGLSLCRGSLITTSDETLKRTFDFSPEALQDPLPYSAAKTATVAEAVRAKYAANIGLAVFGTYSAQDGPYGRTSGNTCIGLATDMGTWTRDYAMGGQDEVAQTWVAVRALDVLRRYLLDLPLVPGAPRG